MKAQCSSIFEDVFNSNTGGICRDCACGKTYFNGDDASDFDEGELEALREKAKAQPDKYIEQQHTVSTMEIDNVEIVYGCTCDTARKYEKFIIQHGAQLATYLNMRAKELRSRADAIDVKS